MNKELENGRKLGCRISDMMDGLPIEVALRILTALMSCGLDLVPAEQRLGTLTNIVSSLEESVKESLPSGRLQ